MLPDGTRDILGIWIENTEGATFGMRVFNELKTRGVEDVLIAVTDGLKGMPETLETVFPRTTLQTCIVHLMRNSLDLASYKDRKPLADAIRPIYTAATEEAARAERQAFEEGPWGLKFPTIAATKLIWLALRNVTEEWTRPSIFWKRAVNQFAILYAERFTRLAE